MFVLPDTTFEATFQAGQTGLTPGWQIRDGQGNVTSARVTTGVIEDPAGSGIYVLTATAPSTTGTYWLVWDTGTITPTTTASEELVVTSTAPLPPGAPGGATDPFVSREDLGDYLGEDLSASDKALIAVDAACDTCRTISEQTFNLVEDETIVLDGTGTDAILLPQLPAFDVTEVTEDDTALVVDDDYKLNANGVLLRMPTVVVNGSIQTYTVVWTRGRQNVEVTYSHGWASNNLPRDVRMVALSFAARLYQQTAGVVFESLGQRSIRYDRPAGDLSNTEKAILRKYKR